MPRIPTVDLDGAPEGAKPILEQIKANFGRVPNFFAGLAHSPAALKTVMGMFGALEEGSLAGEAHEAVTLRVGQLHRCDYCVAAHTAKSKMLGISVEDTLAFRRGEAENPKIKTLLNLTTAMVEKRGQVSDAELQAARDGGLSESEIIECLAIVALNTFTNYANHLMETDVDFPAAPPAD